MAIVALTWPLGAAASPPGEAEDPAQPMKRNAVSFEPLAIASRGLVVSYERRLLPQLSVLAAPGMRFGARSDFSSTTLSLRAEGRWWFIGRDFVSGERGMAGFYLGGAFTAARTSLEHDGRSLGAMWDLEHSLRLGYRFVVFGFQEIAPVVGLRAVHEIEEAGRLAPGLTPAPLAGLSWGWMFL